MAIGEGEITTRFEKALNRHGHAFQYSVLEEAYSLYKSGKSLWVPWVTEFPVEVQGSGTRIDIVFHHPQRNYYLVCECKRANPALANWCFARAPRHHDSGFRSYSYIEVIRYDGNHVRVEYQNLVATDRIFHVAHEIQTDEKGDQSGTRNDEIEQAATQVSRGFNGLIELFGGKRARFLINVNQPLAFIPVIFTTAKIYASEAEVVASDLESGTISKLVPPLTSRDWIWYEYPQSPGLKHGIPDRNPMSDLVEIYYREFVRRIAIVTPSGISTFLGMNVWNP